MNSASFVSPCVVFLVCIFSVCVVFIARFVPCATSLLDNGARGFCLPSRACPRFSASTYIIFIACTTKETVALDSHTPGVPCFVSICIHLKPVRASELYGEAWGLEIELIPLVALLTACDKETPRFNTEALDQLARALAEGARPQADQEKGIREIASAAKPPIGVVTSRSTAAAVAVYERCAGVSSSKKVELKSIKRSGAKASGSGSSANLYVESAMLRGGFVCNTCS
eukprot:IDg18675t1